MFIREAELFKGLDENAMTEISKIMVEEFYDKGVVVYDQNQVADHFFILWSGRVRLAIGVEAEIDYTVSRRGEVFGWSSLVDRDHYSASAECAERSKVYRIDKEKLEAVFEKYPVSGKVFYKRLAGAILQRLLYSYESFMQEGSIRGITSFGTRQVMAAAED